jgi:Spy/CpxP family protein refolding chaperone
MKRTFVSTLLACGASLLLAVSTQAQTPESSPSASPDGGGHGMLKHLTYALGLTGSQQAQIAAILEASKPQFQALHQQRNDLITSVGNQIDPILTGSQQAKFAEMEQRLENGPMGGGHRFGHFGGQGGPGGPGGGGGGAKMLDRLTNELNLSSSQVAQIQPILDASHAQVQATMQNTSLAQADKFSEIKQTMESASTQINALLTPAQQAQYAALKQDFHHRRHGPWASPSPSVSGTD